MSLKIGQTVEVIKNGIVYSGKIINFGIRNESGIPKQYYIEFIVPGTAGQNVFREYVPFEYIKVVTGAPSWNATPNAWPSAASSATTNMASYMAEEPEPFPVSTRVQVWYNGKWEIGEILRLQSNKTYLVGFKEGGQKSNIPRNLIQPATAAAASPSTNMARNPSWLSTAAATTNAWPSAAASSAAATAVRPAVRAPTAASSASLLPSDDTDEAIDIDVYNKSYRSCQDFNFPINFLQKCEPLRQQLWTKLQGDLSGTCGYTGPAIGVILLLFKGNNITGKTSLNTFLRHRYKKLMTPEFGENFESIREIFMASVTETAGNFLDLCEITAVTQTRRGLMGLIQEEETYPGQGKVALVDRTNLVNGVNVISFKERGIGNSTFHHSCIYAIPDENKCFILDSWMDNATMICRLPTCRQYSFTEVQDALVVLNSPFCTVKQAYDTFEYFYPPITFLDRIRQSTRGNTFQVYVLNQEEIKRVYAECETRMIGSIKSLLGGYNHKKKNVKTKKLYKKTNVRTKKPHMRRYIRSKKHRTRRQIRAK
jgi:hypothetical protein